jgi:hypothetical protein
MIYYRIESRIKRYICGELRMVFKSAGLGERTGLLSRLQVVILIIIPFRRIIGSLSIRVYICYLGQTGWSEPPRGFILSFLDSLFLIFSFLITSLSALNPHLEHLSLL